MLHWIDASCSHTLTYRYRSECCTQVEQLAPYYVMRSLETYPGMTPIDSLTAGLDALMRLIPSGDPSSLFIIQKVCDKLLQLWQSDIHKGQFVELMQLLGYLLLVVDFQVQQAHANCHAGVLSTLFFATMTV